MAKNWHTVEAVTTEGIRSDSTIGAARRDANPSWFEVTRDYTTIQTKPSLATLAAIADGTAKVENNVDLIAQLAKTLVTFEIGFEVLPGTASKAALWPRPPITHGRFKGYVY